MLLAVMNPKVQFAFYLVAIVLFVGAAGAAWSGAHERAVALVGLGLALAFVPTAWNLTDTF